MDGKLSVREASARLDLNPSRVRQLASNGQIEAERFGGAWLLDERSVEKRLRLGARAGRPFESANAWALLCLASGQRPEGIDSSVLSRLKRALREDGLEGLMHRLARRGRGQGFRAHQGELTFVIEDPDLVATGVSAAGHLGLDLVPGSEIDGYVRESRVEEFLARHALQASAEGNVFLRAVPDEVWHLVRGGEVAPVAAVALDLLEDADPRSQKAGHQAIQTLLSGPG